MHSFINFTTLSSDLVPLATGELDGSDLEMDELEGGEPRLALRGAPRPRPLPAGSELVIYRQGATAVVPSGVELPTTPDTPTQDHTSPLALPPTSPTSSSTNMLVPATQSGTPG